MTLSQKVRSSLHALSRMLGALSPEAAHRRRLEKRATAAAGSLIDVGGS
jgi:hypothetical protein